MSARNNRTNRNASADALPVDSADQGSVDTLTPVAPVDTDTAPPADTDQGSDTALPVDDTDPDGADALSDDARALFDGAVSRIVAAVTARSAATEIKSRNVAAKALSALSDQLDADDAARRTAVLSGVGTVPAEEIVAGIVAADAITRAIRSAWSRLTARPDAGKPAVDPLTVLQGRVDALLGAALRLVVGDTLPDGLVTDDAERTALVARVVAHYVDERRYGIARGITTEGASDTDDAIRLASARITRGTNAPGVSIPDTIRRAFEGCSVGAEFTLALVGTRGGHPRGSGASGAIAARWTAKPFSGVDGFALIDPTDGPRVIRLVDAALAYGGTDDAADTDSGDQGTDTDSGDQGTDTDA